MKFLVVIALLALGTSAKDIGKCSVSQWGAWSQCHPSRACASEMPDFKAVSYPLPAAEYDSGREHMNIMIKMKEEHWKQQDDCREAGTCPQNVVPQGLGFTPCENGLADIYPCRNIDILSFLNFEELGYINMAPGDRNPRGNDIWGWTDPETGEEYAIMGLSGGTSFVRITKPSEPEVLGFMYTRTSASTWRDMKVIQDTAYIVSEAADHGLQVFDLTRLRTMTQQPSVPIIEPDVLYSEFGNAHNIVANEDTKFLYVVGATRGNYQHCSGGLHVIDVSDRLNPQFAGCFAQDGYVHDAQCVIYHGPDANYQGREVCFCYNENTLTLVDVTDKANMQMISKREYSGYAYTHQGWLTEDHTIALLDDELDENWGSDKRTKTYIWDVQNLADPVLQNVFLSTQEAIDHNQYVRGEYTYQANYRAGLRILAIKQADYDLNEVAFLDTYPANTIAQFDGAWSVYPYFPSENVIVASIDYGLFTLRPDYDAMEQQKNRIYAQKSRSRSAMYCSKGVASPALEQFAPCTDSVC